MEIELDLSVTRPAGNLTFTSTESEAGFLLLGHLSGIAQEKIEVTVNESEGQICITGAGDKSSLETVVGTRLRLKNEFEIGSFRKVFLVPNGMLLDQIEVAFCEDEGILIISVPRSSKGEEDSGRDMVQVEEERGSPTDEEDDVIPKPEDDANAPEQEQEKERVKSPDIKEDELIPEPQVDQAEALKEAEVLKETEEKLKPNGAESSRPEDGRRERGPNDVETKNEIPRQKGEVAETTIHQSDQEKEEPEINRVEEEESEIAHEEEKEETEAKIHQEGEKEQDMDTDTETHLQDIERDEDEEESRKQPDFPEKPSIRIKPSPQHEEPINGESTLHRPSENKEEMPKSIATQAGHDFKRAKEEEQTDQDHREERKGEAHEPEQQVPRPIEEVKPEKGIHQSAMDGPVEGEDERGKKTRKEGRPKQPRPVEIIPPMLVASAFLVSLVGLVIRIFKNQRRR